MRIPLLGGSYSTRSIIASAQRCINYYPERNTDRALVPITHYQRPGLRRLGAAPQVAPVRGLYECQSTGQAFAVIGQGVYTISQNWQFAQIGTLDGTATTPVSFTDNRIDIVLVDGSANVYTINCASGAFGKYVDPNGTFVGARKVDYIDTFVVWGPVSPGSNLFGSTLSNELTTDPLYIAGKTDYNDNLQTIYVNRHLLLLIGTHKTEIWYDAGLATFPFAELPGAFYEHGTVAPYSVASQDISVYMLGQNLQGQGVVFRITGYECKRVSNHALEYQLRQLVAKRGPGALADAIGFTYQLDGHVFYVVTFPTGNQTWQFDEATQEWSQLAWTDSNGNLNRHRANCFGYLYGTLVVGDWENGQLYAMDADVYTDAGAPITFLRTFPHIGEGESNLGAPGLNRATPSDGKEMSFQSFMADLECGLGPLDAQGQPAKVLLRWSADRGRTFGNGLLQTTGRPGEYRARPVWRQLGIGQDVVFELEHNIAGPAALNGAWVEATVLGV